MKQRPKIAIVGRPNVGKSALFNSSCKRRIAIVDEAEGVTRDRLYADADLFGRPFEVIDTGGIHAKSTQVFNEEVKRQAEIAIEEADAIIMVVDGKIGATELDFEVSRILHRTKKPITLAVNKIDNPEEEILLHGFHSLGISTMVPVSASHNRQIAELLEGALRHLPPIEVNSTERGIKVAVIGRPNVGKSSLINFILDEERCIASPIPGTTRDSIDVSFSHGGQQYTFIDTAGIRRKQKEHDVVDKFAFIRTEKAIERADVCLLMLDAKEGMTVQEKRIAGLIEEAGKGCIILLNKWDLMKDVRMEHFLKFMEEEVPFLKHCPKLILSVKTGRNVLQIFTEIQKTYEAMHFRITTGELNKFIEKAVQRNHPPMLRGKRLRIYYMAQVGIAPPTFVMFVNHPDLMAETYQKYLYNQFREHYTFTGVPIIFRLKGKKREDAENRGGED